MGPFTFKKVYMLLHVPIGVYNRLQAVIEFISVYMYCFYLFYCVNDYLVYVFIYIFMICLFKCVLHVILRYLHHWPW